MRSRPPRARWIFVAAVVVGVVAAGAAELLAWPRTAGPSVPGCLGPDPAVADPNAPHGLLVATPPGPRNASAAPLLRTLLNASAACGALFDIPWSAVATGTRAAPHYDWNWTHTEIAPWLAAGKQVDFVLEAVGYAAGESYVPAGMLAGVPTMQCTSPEFGASPVTPVAWNGTFLTAYEGFVRAFLTEFGSLPGVGYVRVGLGTGGEDFPIVGWLTPSCQGVLSAHGYTPSLWLNTTESLLDFESSLHPAAELMVALNDFAGNATWTTLGPELVARRAATDGIALGNEALSTGDARAYANGWPCPGDWCELFDRYLGRSALELNTATASSPNGSYPGSLPQLLPFAVGRHAQCLELYYSDWQRAYDPTFPGYPEYHAAYELALEQAAATLGAPETTS